MSARTIGTDTSDFAARVRVYALVGLTFLLLAHHAIGFHSTFFSGSIAGWEGFSYRADTPRAVVDQCEPTMRDRPNAPYLAGLRKGDLVMAIENIRGERFPIAGLFDHGDAMKTIRWGEPWALHVIRGRTGDVARLVVPPSPEVDLAARDWPIVLGAYLLMPLLCIVTALLVGLSRSNDPNAFRASLMFLGFTALVAHNSDAMPSLMRLFAVALRAFGVGIGAYFFASFFLFFPARSVLDRRAAWLRPGLLGLTLVGSAWQCTALIAGSISFESLYRLRGAVPAQVQQLLEPAPDIALLGGIAIGLSALLLSSTRAIGANEQRRLGLIRAGALITLLPLLALVVAQTFFRVQSPWLLVPVGATIWVFPLLFAYAVVRHQVFGIRLIVRRGLQYTLVTRGMVFLSGILFFIVYALFGPFVMRLLPQASPTFVAAGSAAIAIALAGAFRELNRRVLPLIDRAFFREAYDARRILSELADAVRQQVADPQGLPAFVADQLHAALHPTSVTIVLRREEAAWFVPEAREAFSTRMTGRLPSPPQGSSGQTSSGQASLAEDGSFCCALLAPSPDLPGGAELTTIQRGAPIDVGEGLLALLERVATPGDRMQTLDVIPAGLGPGGGGADGRRDRAAGPNAIRLDQFGADAAELADVRLVVPLATRRRVVGFILLGAKLSEEPYTNEDRELLLSVAGQTAVALDYAQLVAQTAERERLRRELEIAQEVQAQLFPRERPVMRSLAYTGVSRAARILGGDYFDFLPVGPGQLGLALADLSGKGISAALLMATLQGALRSHAGQWGADIAGLMADINGQLYASSAPSKYATFFYGLYDERTQTLRYVNAGHNPPVLVRAGAPTGPAPAGTPFAPAVTAAPEPDPSAGDPATGRFTEPPATDDAAHPAPLVGPAHSGPSAPSAQWAQPAQPAQSAQWAQPAQSAQSAQSAPSSPRIEKLEIGGTVVGLLPDRTYDQATIPLRPGDVLVIYSDGVTDATNPDGDPFGEDRLISLIARHAGSDPARLQGTILDAVEAHAQGVPFEDDVTLVIAKVLG